MKEIGEKLKETREGMGISLEEAAEDLKLRPSQIENIESGNIEAFKDVFYLKYFIRDYSKYLGLKYEDMVDEFNEFLFDYTSKISINDIKNAQKKEIKKEEVKKIASPYTISTTRKSFFSSTFIYIIIVILLILIAYFIVTLMSKDDFTDNSTNISSIWRNYEYIK